MKRKTVAFLTILFFLAVSAPFVWCFFSLTNHRAIPIQFLSYFDTPYATAEIEGQKYCLSFDLGMSFPCDLKQDVLEKLKKQYAGKKKSLDIMGNEYEDSMYFLPKVKVGKTVFKDLPTLAESGDFLLRGISEPQEKPEKDEYEKKIVGFLGLGLFFREKIPFLFLDLSNSSVFMIRNILWFHEGGYDIKKMVKIPMQRKNNCLSIEVETDFGKRWFLLDTGTTLNLLHPSFAPDKDAKFSESKRIFLTSSKFQIGDKDFGSEDFYLYSISPSFGEIDGILGMSFFRKYAVFLDLQNNVAYFGPSQTINTRR
jgi:hypothetical protein